MAYAYGPQGLPAVGGGVPGLPRRTTGYGEISWTLPGTYFWTVPDDFPEDVVHAATVGGGGGGWISAPSNEVCSGAGGALAWANNIPVVPGQVLQIKVASGGLPGISSIQAAAGESSYFKDAGTCAAGGGAGGISGGLGILGGVVMAGSGGNGGNAAYLNSSVGVASGGGSGGYSGKGGDGVATNGAGSVGNAGIGGAGGSGGIGNGPNGSGGVGLYGEGRSGISGAVSTSVNTGGSNGQDGITAQSPSVRGASGQFGAGGGASVTLGIGQPGASGAVRIIWGPDRAFPSQNTGVM
jgi:hypothetical protein